MNKPSSVDQSTICALLVMRKHCPNNAHWVSVSYLFVAGNKTGSKLFSLVQRRRERSYGRKSAASSRAPGGHERQKTRFISHVLLMCHILCFTISILHIYTIKHRRQPVSHVWRAKEAKIYFTNDRISK